MPRARSKSKRPTVPALRVHQWLPSWNKMVFDEKSRRRRPPESFYLFSLNAGELRALAGIQRRTAAVGQSRSDEIGIQRQHDEMRSREIARFVENGYPWSDLSE